MLAPCFASDTSLASRCRGLFSSVWRRCSAHQKPDCGSHGSLQDFFFYFFFFCVCDTFNHKHAMLALTQHTGKNDTQKK